MELNSCYRALVEELRQRYRLRGDRTARILADGDREAAQARGRALAQAFRERLTDPALPEGPLTPRRRGVLEFPAYTIEKLVLDGEGCLPIPVHLYLPRGGGRFPAALVLSGHWIQAKATEAHQRLCANLAMRGIAALAFDPPYQGERCPYTPQELEAMFGPISEDMQMVGLHMLGGNLAYLLGANLGALFVWEARRALDLLCARPDIDHGRIAAVGQSGGGTQACYLAALDDRVKLYAPVQCLSQLAITLEGGIGDCEQSLYGISREEGREQWDVLWAALPKPVLHSAGRSDFFALAGAQAAANEMEAVYRLLGRRGDYTLAVADCGHEFGEEARGHIYGWLTERFLGRRDDRERPTPVLPQEALRCLESPPSQGPEMLYARRLRQLQAARPTEDEAVLAGIRKLFPREMPEYTVEILSETDRRLTFRLNAPYNKSAFCNLEQRDSPGLRLVTSPEELPSEDVSVLTVEPWGIDAAYRKAGMGYDLETCLFNASAVLGRTLALERTAQLLFALTYALSRTGALWAEAVGVDAGAVPVLLAACLDRRIRAVALARCPVSFDDLFARRTYFLQETSMVPGLLEIADLPRLCALTGAAVFQPLGPDRRPCTREEIQREDRVPCLWCDTLAPALDGWFREQGVGR